MDTGLVGVAAWDILATLPQAIVVADREGHIVYANPATASVLRWDPDTLIGQRVAILTPPRLRGIHLAAFERYMDTGVATIMGQPLEVSALCGDGSETDVLLTLAACDAAGHPFVIGTISERVADPDILNRGNELGFQLDFTRAIMGSLGDGVYALDRQGRVTYLNQTAQRMLGWTEAELLGRDMHDTIHYRRDDGTLMPRDQCPLIDVMVSGVVTHAKDDTFIRRDGSSFPVAYTSAPIVTRGEIVGAALSFRDRTTERDLEREKELFLSSVAHDLQSPLTSIKGFTQLLLRRAQRSGTLSAGQITPSLETVEATVDRVISLVNELLDTTRVRMGRSIELEAQPCDLVHIVRVAQESIGPESTQRIMTVAECASLWGEWDASRLQRVLANLLSNAVKYSPASSCIEVRVRQDGDMAVLQVWNEGIGIPAADLPLIFDQFHRATNVRGQLPGTGIGLASARHIVERHGGTIEVQSQEGQGATFTVRLPLRPAETAPPAR